MARSGEFGEKIDQKILATQQSKFKKIGLSKDGIELTGIEHVKSGYLLGQFLNLEKETNETKMKEPSVSLTDEEDNAPTKGSSAWP